VLTFEKFCCVHIQEDNWIRRWKYTAKKFSTDILPHSSKCTLTVELTFEKKSRFTSKKITSLSESLLVKTRRRSNHSTKSSHRTWILENSDFLRHVAFPKVTLKRVSFWKETLSCVLAITNRGSNRPYNCAHVTPLQHTAASIHLSTPHTHKHHHHIHTYTTHISPAAVPCVQEHGLVTFLKSRLCSHSTFQMV